MTNLRQQRGQIGEDTAVRHLEALGYRLVARNWRPSHKSGSGGMRGEVDIIAWQGKVLCFVEVKARSGNLFGAPQEAVTSAKQRQISRLANAYVSLHRLSDVSCRFDVVEVWLPRQDAAGCGAGLAPRVQLHQNAFDYRE